MGIPPDLARSALRLSLGRETTSADILRAASVIPAIVTRLRHPTGALHA